MKIHLLHNLIHSQRSRVLRQTFRLGIHQWQYIPTVQEARDDFVGRLTFLFADEGLSLALSLPNYINLGNKISELHELFNQLLSHPHIEHHNHKYVKPTIIPIL
ncbi:hypothetical protein ACJIZ3_011112 [Penstemon smallii]|uniref:Uncharacterized protein n=1 Tax=Penstemon smallii TaxID=265156 RepID=A0ABD3UIL7_9LAMI